MIQSKAMTGEASTALRQVLLIGLTAMVASWIFAALDAKAQPAARYVYEFCDSALPSGGDAGAQYSGNGYDTYTPLDNCNQQGGAIGIVQSGATSHSFVWWNLPIYSPPGGSADSVTFSAAICTANGTYGNVWTSGWPLNCQPEQTRTFQLGGPVYSFFPILLGCSQDACPAYSAGVYAHYIAVNEADATPPTLTNLQGSLLAGGVLRGHQPLSIDADDKGGGISNIAVSVNGLPAAQPKVSNCNVANTNNPSVSGVVAAAVSPCPSDVSANWTLDTQTYPFHDGGNVVQVCASDFATLSNPNTTCSTPQAITVDNSCTDSPVGGGDVLTAQFAESHRDTVTMRHGKGATVTGQLSDDSGDPVSGATLCVKMQIPGVDPHATAVGAVKTDAGGRYSYPVSPGPNRDVVIGYRHDTEQIARDVRFYAHARPTLHVSPRGVRNGDVIRLWGALPGPHAGGRVVVLEASVPGSHDWLTFRKATANGKGRFHSGYRFTRTLRSTTYRMRAVIPEQAGYPWAEGHSKPARVRVSG